MAIKSILVLISVLIQQVVLFEQHAYKIKHESLTIEEWNEDFLESPVINLFQFNETAEAFNGSGIVKKELNNDLWAHVKAYLQNADGKTYHQYPGKYIINLCEAQKEDIFGTREIFEHSNLTDCPIKPGYYYVDTYRPDESKFPPWIPYGKLRAEVLVYHGNIYLYRHIWHGRVEPL